METRVCACCGETKSVSTVWYLLADGSGSFMCGTCFSTEEGNHVPPVRA